MLSIILLVVLAITLFAYIAVPLVSAYYIDPLPDLRDPVLESLEEERDALFRAIQELEKRDDLPQERRDALRSRYEAKVAKTLRAIDEYKTPSKKATKSKIIKDTKQPFPLIPLMFLAIMLASASALGGWILPRASDAGASLTASGSGLEASQELAAARANVEKLTQDAKENPSIITYTKLGNAYWQRYQTSPHASGNFDDDLIKALENFEKATKFKAISAEESTALATALRLLGIAGINGNIDDALANLEASEKLEPNNLDTLYSLGEVYFATNRPEDAIAMWERYLEQPEGSDDPTTTQRINIARQIVPLTKAVQEDPSEDTLLALANGYWEAEERDRAADIYFLLLTEENPDNALALSRLGQVIFFAGKNEDAIGFLAKAKEKAQEEDPEYLPTLLFLGNAYFSLELYESAIETWEEYVAVAGGEENAGRIPSLIEDARDKLAGTDEPTTAENPDTASNDVNENTNTTILPTRTLPLENPDLNNSNLNNSNLNNSNLDNPNNITAQPQDKEENAEENNARNEQVDTAAVLELGKQAYLNNCASCHGLKGQGGVGVKFKGNKRVQNPDYVKTIALNGKGMMPAYDGILDNETITAISNYISQELAP